MSTSAHTGIVPFASSLYGAADDPMCTAILRDGVANGLLHAADAAGMVRVNFTTRTGESTLPDIDTVTAGQWYLLQGFPMGPWPLTMGSDGTPYRLRVRMAGLVDDGGTATITLRLVIAPTFAEALAGRTLEEDHVFEVTTTGTSAAWLTGTSQGSAAAATYVEVSAEQALAWTRTVGAYDAVSLSTPVSIEQVLVSAWVLGKSTVGAERPALSALHVAEVFQP